MPCCLWIDKNPEENIKSHSSKRETNIQERKQALLERPRVQNKAQEKKRHNRLKKELWDQAGFKDWTSSWFLVVFIYAKSCAT
jgi:hypothetical protein